MAFRESETVELKRIVVDDIKKEIVAFANCDGGKLYIGIEDDGTVIGLDDADQTVLQNINADHEKSRGTETAQLSRDEMLILDYAKQNGYLTRRDVEQLLGTSASSSVRILRRMVENGMLTQVGKGRAVRYRIP